MRLKYPFETMELEGRIVVVPISDDAEGFHGVIKVNEVGLAILELLNNNISEKEIVDALAYKYRVDRDVLANDIHNFLIQFESRGLLVE